MYKCPYCKQDSYNKLYRGVAQYGRASGLGPEGRGFKSFYPDQYRGDEAGTPRSWVRILVPRPIKGVW